VQTDLVGCFRDQMVTGLRIDVLALHLRSPMGLWLVATDNVGSRKPGRFCGQSGPGSKEATPWIAPSKRDVGSLWERRFFAE
jgi:hypothetical protein